MGRFERGRLAPASSRLRAARYPAPDREAIVKTVSKERVFSVIDRLKGRNRWRRAAALLEAWMRTQRLAAEPEAVADWHNALKLGDLLKSAGEFGQAAAAYRECIALLMQGKSSGITLKSAALNRLATCLDALDMPKSAAETRALVKRLSDKYAEENPPAKVLSPSRLLTSTASRCTFALSLSWKATSLEFTTKTEGDFSVLRDLFRVEADKGQWLELELKAPVEEEPNYPHVAMCVRFPWPLDLEHRRTDALELVNKMNLDSGAVSASLQSDCSQIVVCARLGFAGFNEGWDDLDGLNHAQHEAVLNMTLEVIQTALAWESAVMDLALKARPS